MERAGRFLRIVAFAAAAVGLPAGSALAQAPQDGPLQLAGAACPNPLELRCPEGQDCGIERITHPGGVVEMKTRRNYFLDYPCDLKPGEKVTFILSLHGAGSFGNWQRHYFPLVDYKDKYRLVIATPNSPIRFWTEADDAYLQGIAESVIAQIGADHVRSFWLVGHSQGGMTSNRLVRTDFFKEKVDGFLSLSGGRIGGNPGRAATFGAGRPNTPRPGVGAGGNAEALAAARAALAQPPETDFSFIFAIGQREMDEKGLLETSAWAERYHCGARSKPREIADSKPGYVYDASRQNPPNPAWGLLPAPGKAQVFLYPDCADGRLVADVVRLEKGHTEGLEPKVTEELVKLIVAAPGGKLQRGSVAAH